MINLLTMECCRHGCPEFEPKVMKDDVEYPDEMRVDTTIECVHKQKCESLLDYLRKEAKR